MTVLRFAFTRALLPALAAFSAAGAALAQTEYAALAADDLSRFSIEELAQIEVTSVSKHPESLAHAPSAIYVITNQDIQRSGYQTLPEVLRLAPNLEVMRIDALDYTITARGSAGFEAANKLLALIDGRSIYTPLSSGVDWDQHHLVLADIDRIEVISGPGGTLWGANAVNGVINVTTRSAYDTQGLLVNAAAGTLDTDLSVRYGGQMAGGPAWRIYANAYSRRELDTPTGAGAGDGWDGGQVGFRADWRTGPSTFTVQGDISDNSLDEAPGVPQGYVKAANLFGRWSRELAGGALELQTYYDSSERESRGYFDILKTWDIEGHYTFTRGAHQIVAGGGYRLTEDTFRLSTGGPNLLDPAQRETSIGNVFVQDALALRDNLTLTVGLKFEDNNYTGGAVLPNLRLAWRVNDTSLIWGAISRAVRTPSRIERDFSIPGVVQPGIMDIEKLTAYELGYRGQPMANLNVSVSLFYNDYDGLRTNELTPVTIFPIRVGNGIEGKTYGAELNATFDVTPRWRLSGGVTVLEKDYNLKPGILDFTDFESVGYDPSYWAKLRSEFKLTDTLDLELRVRAYDDVPPTTADGYLPQPAYVEADARLAWQVRSNVELSLSALNLLNDRHTEAPEERRGEIPRTLVAGLRWTY